MNSKNGPDTEVVLTFFAMFSRFEQALKKAGFTKAGQNAQPDWERFIMEIEGRFDPEATPALYAAVQYMLGIPVKGPAREEIPRYQSDILKLSTLIQEAGNNLSRNVNFEHYAESAYEVMFASIVIMETWSHCDPNIEGILNAAQ